MWLITCRKVNLVRRMKQENEKDNDLDNVQNSTSDQNQAEDNKQDEPLENEQSINDAHDITKKTGQDEEQNANADDMQV